MHQRLLRRRSGDFFVVKSATAPDGKTVSIKAISVGTASMLGQSVDALAKEIDMFRLCGNGAHVCAALALERDDDAICLVLEAVAGAALNVQLARGGENYQVVRGRTCAFWARPLTTVGRATRVVWCNSARRPSRQCMRPAWCTATLCRTTLCSRPRTTSTR